MIYLALLAGGLVLAVLWSGGRGLGRQVGRLQRAGQGKPLGLVFGALALILIARGRLDIGLTFALLAAFNLARGRLALKAKFDGWTASWRAADQLDLDARRAAGDEPAAARHTQGMSQNEAYQLLGLGEGASRADVGKAYRRLMKEAHPDHGGSAQRAARLNEAKQVLTRRHR
jgi:hypothetical protein